MKKVLLVLSFVFAIGSAFTTKYVSAVDGYSRIADFPSQGENCKKRVTNCDTQGTVACTFQSVQLYDNTCTTPLNKIAP